jgi:hypothetical protein
MGATEWAKWARGWIGKRLVACSLWLVACGHQKSAFPAKVATGTFVSLHFVTFLMGGSLVYLD